MVERRNGKPPAVRLEYTFDRLLVPKLAQVYERLVPARVRIIGEEHKVKDGGNEDPAIYARVSSDKQKEENTIFSQTAALKEFADAHEFNVPEEWVFEDDGYSGASLVRPGLEKVRDLAAEGHIQAVLVYSPDHLSRKYAYQVLLTEEFGRYGVDTVFVKSPQSATPECQLLLQFQGVIAEYERAQILERSRRGKLYRAKAGEVGVLSSAPYGYRFIRKGVDVASCFEVVAAEAEIVLLMFEKYTLGGLTLQRKLTISRLYIVVLLH
jgi:site-specific DNA recombinase